MKVKFYHGTDYAGYYGIDNDGVIKKGCITPVKKYAMCYAKPYLFSLIVHIPANKYIPKLICHRINRVLEFIFGDYLEYLGNPIWRIIDLYDFTIECSEWNPSFIQIKFDTLKLHL